MKLCLLFRAEDSSSFSSSSLDVSSGRLRNALDFPLDIGVGDETISIKKKTVVCDEC
jgi:hypothetical protein